MIRTIAWRMHRISCRNNNNKYKIKEKALAILSPFVNRSFIRCVFLYFSNHEWRFFFVFYDRTCVSWSFVIYIFFVWFLNAKILVKFWGTTICILFLLRNTPTILLFISFFVHFKHIPSTKDFRLFQLNNLNASQTFPIKRCAMFSVWIIKWTLILRT